MTLGSAPRSSMPWAAERGYKSRLGHACDRSVQFTFRQLLAGSSSIVEAKKS